MEWPMVAIMLIFGISVWILVYQIAGSFAKEKYINRIGLYTGQVDIKKEDRQKNMRITARDWECWPRASKRRVSSTTTRAI